MYRVLFYENPRGHCQVDAFLDKMPLKERAKVEKWIEKLETEGPNLPRPYADIVKGKIRELRIRFGSNHYRFLYFFFKKEIIITHGFKKKTDRVPQSEITKAKQAMQNFLKRLKEGEIKL